MPISTRLIKKEEEEHIRKILPLLLKNDVQFRREISIILSETFSTKEEIRQILEELRAFRQEATKRFEAVDKRFETMQAQMDKRFEAVDRRFETMQAQMDKRFEAMDRRFEEAREERQNLEDWVGVVIGGFQRRAGRNLEDAVAGTLKAALRRKDVRPENISLRKKFTDDEGVIGPKGRSYEIDLYIHNSESMVFEIKSYAEIEDIYRFNDKAELIIKRMNLVNPLKVFVTLEKQREVAEICQELGIELA